MISLESWMCSSYWMELHFSWTHNGYRSDRRRCFSREESRGLLEHACLGVKIESMVGRRIAWFPAGCLQSFVIGLLVQGFLGSPVRMGLADEDGALIHSLRMFRASRGSVDQPTLVLSTHWVIRIGRFR